MKVYRELLQQAGNIEARLNERMAPYTSFKIGGPADVMLLPSCLDELQQCLVLVKELKLPSILIGGGTNILVSDRGIRGVVIQTTAMKNITVSGSTIIADAGASVEQVSEAAVDHGLGGLEFIHGMPGSIGGAVWMNARCYGGSMSDVLGDVEVLSSTGEHRIIPFDSAHYDYKISPFQKMEWCIYRAHLHLSPEKKDVIRQKMNENKSDRVAKGHFSAPSAGSLFKNDRSHGAPTGMILDELGLRGVTRGGAAIAPFHGNIFINSNNAKATDVVSLIKLAMSEALAKRKIRLEPEIRFVGDWQAEELSFLAG